MTVGSCRQQLWWLARRVACMEVERDRAATVTTYRLSESPEQQMPVSTR
jgi:hypothetical protein